MAWCAGIDRSAIDWGPTIDPRKCVGCGICMNCGKKVFDWVDGKSVVARRDACVVGCMTCGNLCQGHAISFPSLDALLKLYRKNKVWAAVKEQLVAAGTIPPES